ncbi:unnamed protein product [Gemmata massiliana]|uniref:Zinc finger/thioredoxin putative domain-containing protein n=1 Tax=Gemmata massiliana TaxID=1210884 RepID=A0A6P2CQN7_9BACT|nr:hypothetical protein [Gemmata massiliana]VTR91271.1 unnamed protein product [Gemmata massiliana]
MSVIVVDCPGCPAKLSAPETAAGKQIRCPKCGAVATVPALVQAEEVSVVDGTLAPPPPKPRPKPVPVDDDEDSERPRTRARRAEDDDEEDERPRKKKRRRAADDDDDDPPPRKRRRKSGGVSAGIIVLAVVGGLLLVCGIGFGIYALTGKNSLFAKKTPVPAGWKEFSYPQDGFKAYFPSEPTTMGMNLQFGQGMPLAGGGEVPQMESMRTYMTGGFGNRDRVDITVQVMRLRSSLPRASRDAMGNIGGRFAGGSARRVRWLGGDAAEMELGGTLTRIVYLEKMVIIVQITGPNGTRAKSEEEAAFFDNFEVTK